MTPPRVRRVALLGPLLAAGLSLLAWTQVWVTLTLDTGAVVEARGDADEGGRIAIGAMPLSRALLLPHALALFLADARGTVIDVVEGSWR